MTATWKNQHSFSHDAMATTFEIFVAGEDPVYARQATAAAFDELDVLEGHLSRFVESSDISRINRLARGESTVVALDTFRCLQLALDVERKTGGAFDVAYQPAERVGHVSNVPMRARDISTMESCSMDSSRGCYTTVPRLGCHERLGLSAEGCRVRVLADGVRLDLGGIGKGFALDCMAALLGEWEIEFALLRASTSTLLALGPPPDEPGWPVDFGPPHDRHRIMLSRAAFSASGTAVKGNHIIDPRTGRPAEGPIRCWAGAPTAAVADALSTACMVMTEEEIRACCSGDDEISVHLQRFEDSPLLTVGNPRQ